MVEKPKKDYKTLKGILIGIGIASAVGLVSNRAKHYYFPISQKDYDNANWYSASCNPYNAYMNENIPHNRITWMDYQDAVREKNGKLSGATLFPDLDKNGKVGE